MLKHFILLLTLLPAAKIDLAHFIFCRFISLSISCYTLQIALQKFLHSNRNHKNHTPPIILNKNNLKVTDFISLTTMRPKHKNTLPLFFFYLSTGKKEEIEILGTGRLFCCCSTHLVSWCDSVLKNCAFALALIIFLGTVYTVTQSQSCAVYAVIRLQKCHGPLQTNFQQFALKLLPQFPLFLL
jgi:hypothetical protein